MLADSKGSSPWSDASFDEYHGEVNMSRNVVIGTDTYRVMKKYDDFADFDDTVRVVVVSEKGIEIDESLSCTVVSSPQAALDLLSSEGFERAHIAGGATLGTHMLKDGLIDELWLDIEPQLFGSGLNLIDGHVDANLHLKLRFLSSKMVSDDVIQLRYSVST